MTEEEVNDYCCITTCTVVDGLPFCDLEGEVCPYYDRYLKGIYFDCFYA